MTCQLHTEWPLQQGVNSIGNANDTKYVNDPEGLSHTQVSVSPELSTTQEVATKHECQ